VIFVIELTHSEQSGGTPMIKKLRIKFIVMTMISLSLVLGIIMAGVNIINYRGIVKDADEILEVLMENDGKFPQIDNKGDLSEDVSGEMDLPKTDSEDIIPEQNNPGDRGPIGDEPDSTDMQDKKLVKRNDSTGIMTPETPYESRFFSVLLDEKGNTISVDTGKIAAIDTSEAISYGYNIFQQKQEKGFLDVYRYIKKENEGGIRIIFLDCSRNMASFRSFLITSLIISLVGIIAVLFLLIIFSKRLVKPMAESYEKQKQFITDAGHEIKTPLSVIQADVELLEMECGEENEWICDIQNQIKRMTALTNDLIYLARMEEGENSLQYVEFSFSDMVEEVVQSFQAPALTKNISLNVNLEDLLTIKGSEKTLRQLVTILMDNAIKYSPDNEEVLVNLKKKNKSICLQITNATHEQAEDTQLDHMFDRFYRGDSSRNSQTGGFGIGLSIAKAVVDVHKGKISASLTEENKLCITAILPLTR
jgi:signal transduction histidine kinase